MNFNATLIGQTITFIVFVWFCMKFIWPPIMHALDERRKKIADGLAAAERGKHEKELAEERDELGLRRVNVEWRLGELERRTIAVATRKVAAELTRLGLGIFFFLFVFRFIFHDAVSLLRNG